MKRMLLTAAVLAGTLTAAFGIGSAGAAEPCWRTAIDDWYQNGQLDSRYSVACYREVLKHITTDLQIYSDLPDKVNRALQAALLSERVKGTTHLETEPAPSGKADRSMSGSSRQGRSNGPVERVLDQLGPDRADAVPIPLLVLAGVALLLIAAGAISAVTRRLGARRVPPE
jgi:hypothetical protein